MLLPKKTKYRKAHKIKVSGVATSCCNVSFGSYGLKVTDGVKITAKQLEAVRKVISRELKRSGALYFRIFPQMPITKKPLGVRMGGGKGSTEAWIAPIARGSIIAEVDNVSHEMATNALLKAQTKLPIKCVVVKRRFAYFD